MMDHRKVDFDYDYREFKRQIADLDVRIAALKGLTFVHFNLDNTKSKCRNNWLYIVTFAHPYLHAYNSLFILPNAYLIADRHPEIPWDFFREIANHNALIKVVDDIRETKS